MGKAGFSKVGEPTQTFFDAFDEFAESTRAKSEQSSDDKNAVLIDAALRNRTNIKRLLRSLRIPNTFANLMLMCAFVILVSIAAVVTMYVVFSQLFYRLSEESKIVFYQMDVFRTLCESSSIVLQLISVNEYVLGGNMCNPIS